SRRVATKERGRYTTGNNRFSGSIGVSCLHLGRTRVLGIRHLQAVYVYNSFQVSHPLEEIQNRVIGAVNIDGERHFTVKLAVCRWHGGVPPDLDTRGCRRVMQQADELVGILVVRNHLLLPGDLLFLNSHLPLDLLKKWLELPELLVFRSLSGDFRLKIVVFLDLIFQVEIVEAYPSDGGDKHQDPQPLYHRHFVEFRHKTPEGPPLHYDCFCTLLEKPISQMSSNLNACTSLIWASCAVSLISTDLNCPVFLRFAIRSATASALKARPVKFRFLPSVVIVSSHIASVLLTVSATMLSISTGPFCASFRSWMTLTLRV